MTISMAASGMADIPFAGIRTVFEKAARLEKKGRQVIHMEVGKPDFDTPEHIKAAAVAALAEGNVHYTPNKGVPILRAALAESLQEYKGIDYDPEKEIMATAGGQEAMFLSLRGFLNPGDEVLVPNPGYSQFNSCIKLTGGVPVPLPLLADENFVPDLTAARKVLTNRTRALIVNSPHNPTGAVLTTGQVEAICRFAGEHDLVIFSDEAYDRMIYDGHKFLSPAACPEMKDRTVIWGSLSKTYSMTGWRVGYIAAPQDLISAAIKVQQNVMLSICSFAQAGAVAALKGDQTCVDRMVEAFDHRRRIILKGLENAPGLTCPVVPKGAFYVFARHDVPGMNTHVLADHLLDKGGVAVVPGTSFGTMGEGFLRISYAVSSEKCREGMDRIAHAMTGLGG
ncbi:MAG: pyridoxal phosphate-dependent aminotransferase [Desulfobacterales bacterium]|jgi:aspartate/methionine/tyrosine aminotransferase